MDDDTTQVLVTLLDKEGELADDVLATPLGGNLYQLVETGLLSPSGFGDLVEAEQDADGVLVMIRTVQRGRFEVVCGLIPRGFTENEEFRSFAAVLCNAGGQWQLDFGGMLRLHFPLRSRNELKSEWERVVATWYPGTSSSQP